MSLVDKDKLLSDHEVKTYGDMLAKHGLNPEDFHIQVTEDQDEMDMEDLSYVVMLYVKVTHPPTNTSKTYSSKQNSGLWIQELEEDIVDGIFNSGTQAK